MANLLDPFAGHLFGVRLGEVRHACPACPTFYPNAFCPTCLGNGTITEAELARWVRLQNAAK